YRSCTECWRTRVADSVRGISTDVGTGSAGGWPKSSDLIAARSLSGGNSGRRYMFSRMSPSKRCSVVISWHPVFEASKRAKKITRRARSVNLSNMVLSEYVPRGDNVHPKPPGTQSLADRITVYCGLYARDFA